MPKNTTFDFLKPKDKEFFPISFRVMRFKISENSYETLITNLDLSEFTTEDIKKLYHMRWGLKLHLENLNILWGLLIFIQKS